MKNTNNFSRITAEGITMFTPPPSEIPLNGGLVTNWFQDPGNKIKQLLTFAGLFIALSCLQLFAPLSTFAQTEEDPDAQLVCVQIQVVDLAQISGATMYASSPLSADPNTINICKAADFEISDDPWVAEGRCFVPPAEG